MNIYFLISAVSVYLPFPSQGHVDILKCNLPEDYCLTFHIQAVIYLEFIY